LNCGIGLSFLLIASPFFATHCPRRNDPNEAACATQREGYVQQPASIRTSQRMQPWLRRAVPDILHDQERIIEEDLLGLALSDAMLGNALAPVVLVPLEALDPR
jgi:hypothetical protein